MEHADPVRDPWQFRIGTIGAFGVPVFFLLSAYLITELLLRERERIGRIHISSFYMRRILRIWPLYFATFFGLALLNHFLPGVGTDNPRAWLAFAFFSGNWYVSHHGWIAGPVDPLWSISVEEQFYIVIPILAALGNRRILRYVSYCLLPIAYATIWFHSLHPVSTDNHEWTNSFVQFQFFCAGMLIALFLRGRVIKLSIPLRFTGFAIGFICWLTAVVRFHVQSWNPQATVAGSLAGWLLVLAGTVTFFLSALGTPSQWIPSWLSYLGRISYGLYLFHSLMIFLMGKLGGYATHRWSYFYNHGRRLVVLEMVLVLALSIGSAHLSFKYFESPFLRLKKRFTFVPSRA